MSLTGVLSRESVTDTVWQQWHETVLKSRSEAETQAWLKARRWEKGQAGPAVDQCWLTALDAGAKGVLKALFQWGLVLSPSPALERSVNILVGPLGSGSLWDQGNLERFAVWSELAPALPGLTDQQARCLAHAGGCASLALLLRRGAWAPSPEALKDVYASARGQNGGYWRFLLLEEGLKRYPEWAGEHASWVVGAVSGLLHEACGGHGLSDVSDVQKRWKSIRCILECLGQAGVDGSSLSPWVLPVASKARGSVPLLAALGNIGVTLPTNPKDRKVFWNQVAKYRFQGEDDGRLNEAPWRAWACDPLSQAVLEEAFVGLESRQLLRAWKAWQLEASWEDAAVSAPPRSRL